MKRFTVEIRHAHGWITHTMQGGALARGLTRQKAERVMRAEEEHQNFYARLPGSHPQRVRIVEEPRSPAVAAILVNAEAQTEELRKQPREQTLAEFAELLTGEPSLPCSKLFEADEQLSLFS